ncbi:MAG: four helix bundle protein [Acidobacteriota bacterium]
MDLAEGIYVASRVFPKSETYGLSSQVRKAAVSIASNVAEGQTRRSTSEYQRFLSIAQGLLSEVETQVLLARRLNYLEEPRRA